MKVLLIEDNEHDQKLLKQILEPYTEKLIIKSDGETALKALKEVDLVILDLNLPFHITGKDLLRIIKRRRRTIPVVVYSTSNNPDDVRYCYQNGCACYVTKPYGLVETLEKLEHLGEFWKGVTYAIG